jgi:hypothetical protein
MKRTTWIAPLALWAALAAPCRADEVSDSLKQLPGAANAVAVINVDALYKSPRSLRDGWAKKQEIADSVHLPTSVATLVIGYHVDQGNADDSWRVGLATLKRPVPMATIAEKEKGQIELIGSYQAVLSRRQAYFIGMSPTSVAISYPANRQDTARWLQFAKSSTKPAVSSYLQEAVTGNRTDHIVAAFDMEEMVEPGRLRAWLASTKTAQEQSPTTLNEMRKVLVKLRGFRFSARVYDQTIVTKMSFDFGGSPKDFGKVLKSLFLEALDDFGAALDDFKNCQVQTEGNTVTFRCDLSDEGLARVMSLLLLPEADAGSEDGSGEADTALAASKRYYKEVKQIVEDLRKKYKTATNYNRTAVWHDNYAQKIERLPATNVDKELLEYGAAVAGYLRGVAASLRGVPLNVDQLQSQMYYRWYQPPPTPVFMGGGGGFGGFGFNIEPTQYYDNFAEIRGKQAEVIQQGSAEREKLWQSIDAASAAIRQKMIEKYKADFDAQAK